MNADERSRKAILAYVLINGLFTLAASLIWAINTIFLLQVGHLSLFEVMIVNSVFTLGQMVFEVPTGVIADTIGRRISIILSMLTIAAATLGYVAVPRFGWGIAGFCVASIGLGLGYTMQTGAIDAWVVDALDALGWEGSKDSVFASAQMAMSAGTLIGSLLGGLLGQVNLALPYLLRTVLLLACFVVAVALVHDMGFQPRELKASNFGVETRRIFSAGVRFGLGNKVVRPLLWASGLSGLFFMFGFYAWQPYVLKLAGGNYVWLLGVVQAASSGAAIAGNWYVRRRRGRAPRHPANTLAACSLAQAALVAGIGLVGIFARSPGWLPAAVAIALWLGWGFIYGIVMPVRMSYLNAQVPSAQRATVLSFDAFFLDGGSAVGQPALGWVSDHLSMSVAWLIGGGLVALTTPLYRRSGRAAAESGETA